MSDPGHYSDVAVFQLKSLAGKDPDLYGAVMDACEFVIAHPLRAQAMSAAIQVPEADRQGVVHGRGMVMRMPVVGYPPWKVFWTTLLPRIEAVFEFPT